MKGQSEWVVSVLRLSRLQFAGLSASSFIVGYMPGGPVNGWLIAAATVAYFIDQASGAMFNAYADRTEDRVNMPDFAAMAERIGYRTIRRLAVALKLVTTVALLAFYPWYPAAVTVGLIIGLFPAMYSVGLRFKNSTLMSFVSHGLYTTGPFLTGWALARGWDIPLSAWLYAGLLGYTFAVNRTIRSFPDIEGDKASGAANFWTKLAESGRLRTWQTLLLSPYVLVGILTAFGLLPVRMLAVLPLVGLSLCLGVFLDITRKKSYRVAAWHWGILYSLLAHGVLLLAILPRFGTVIAVAGMIAVRLLATGLGLDYRANISMAGLWRLTRDVITSRRAPASA